MTILTPDMILQAYRAGFFPMAPDQESAEISWYDPDVRGVLPIAGLHVPKRLQRTVRKRIYQITFDRDFDAVIHGCAFARSDTWINDEILALYTALYHQGFAHSVEAWKGGKLVGGLYGIALGGAFFGESMFSVATDASKVALVHLVARLWRHGFELLDTQFINEHLIQFGVCEIPRAEYLERLEKALGKEVSFQSSKSGSEFSSSLAGSSLAGSSLAGSPSGSVSDENSSGFGDVSAFLHLITQTS